MSKPEPISLKQYLGPRYWPTWIGIGLLFITAWLPHRARMFCGSVIGMLTWLMGGERRYITTINIRMCFPELSENEQRDMVRRSYQSNGIGLLETAASWFRHPRTFRNRVSFPNPEVMMDALAEGRGVLLLGAHYSMLDLGGSFQSLLCSFAVTYRPHPNPLFNAFMTRGRLRDTSDAFDRNDIRAMFRHLKQGKVLWYAPDQDYGELHAVYAPFFGNPAATITTPARFAAVNNSVTVIVRYRRETGNRGYIMDFERLPDEWPGGNDIADATLVNSYIERAIRLAPEQYMWMHKRFKTQPGGKPESPYFFIKTPVGKLRSQRLREMLEVEGTRVNTLPTENRSAFFLQKNGMYLRLMAGDVRKRPKLGSAHRMDRLSKHLRHVGIQGLTVNRWFRLPGRKQYGLLCHLPGELSLGHVLDCGQDVNWTALGKFLADCHEHGINTADADPLTLGLNERGFFLVYLEDCRLHPLSLCIQDRVNALKHCRDLLRKHQAVSDNDLTVVVSGYLDSCTPPLRREIDAGLG